MPGPEYFRELRGYRALVEEKDAEVEGLRGEVDQLRGEVADQDKRAEIWRAKANVLDEARRMAVYRMERAEAQVAAVRALTHADDCCARGCIADRGPCCGSKRCTCYLKKILAALDGAVPPPAAPTHVDSEPPWAGHEYRGGSWLNAKCQRVESGGCSWYECDLPASDPIHGGDRG